MAAPQCMRSIARLAMLCYLLLGVHLVISWVAFVTGAAFVLVGAHLRGHIVRRWGEPGVLRSWWVRAAVMVAVVVSLGVPAMNGHVVLASLYGLGLGLLGPARAPAGAQPRVRKASRRRPRRWAATCSCGD